MNSGRLVPVPILLIASNDSKKAKDIIEIVKMELEKIGKILFSANWNGEIECVNSRFCALMHEFPVLDYETKFSNDPKPSVCFGLPKIGIVTRITYSNGEVIIEAPPAPYYISHVHYAMTKETVLASPHWLPVTLALITLSDEYKMSESYIYTKLSSGYGVGRASIDARISKVPVGARAVISPITGTVSIDRHIDLQEKRTVTATQAATLLLEGSKKFLDMLEEKGAKELWVALSGGLDSRTVLASLVKARDELNSSIKIRAYTIKAPTTDPVEIEIAKNISEFLGIEHNIIRLDDPVKKKIIADICPMILTTDAPQANGTGGDKTLVPLGRLRSVIPNDPKKAALSVFRRYDYSPAYRPLMERIRSIEHEVIDSLLKEFSDSLAIIRNYILEYRLGGWLTLFRQPAVTPFLYPPFFLKTFLAEPTIKNYLILYARVIKEINEGILRIPYYNIGCRISSSAMLQKATLPLCLAKTVVKKILKGQRGSLVPNKEIVNIIQNYYEKVRNILSTYNNGNINKEENIVKWVIVALKKLFDKDNRLDAREITIITNGVVLLYEVAAIKIGTGEVLSNFDTSEHL